MTAERQTDLPPPESLVFVYGTLQAGGQYHQLLADTGAIYVGSGKTDTAYPLLIAAYPCLLDIPGKGYPVEGEVYRLPKSEGWRILDRLEGHPQEYRRRREPIICDNKWVHAWTYFYIRKDLRFGTLPMVRYFNPREGRGIS